MEHDEGTSGLLGLAAGLIWLCAPTVALLNQAEVRLREGAGYRLAATWVLGQ